MAATKTEVFNEVLDHLGLKGVQSWEEDTPTALKLRQAWNPVVQGLLEMHPWNFGSATEQLQIPSGETHPGYSYVYALPSQCVRLNWISRTARYEDAIRHGWILEGDRIAASWDTLYAGFVHQRHIESPARWPQLFASAVASVLARRVSRALTDNRTLSIDLTEAEQNMIYDAQVADAMNSAPPIRQIGNWNRGRMGYGSPTGEL